MVKSRLSCFTNLMSLDEFLLFANEEQKSNFVFNIAFYEVHGGSGKTHQKIEEVKNWLEECCSGKILYDYSSDNKESRMPIRRLKLYFSKQEDLVLFKSKYSSEANGKNSLTS